FKHKVFDTIEDLLEALGRINFTTYNYYFCVSTLRERSVTDGDKNRVRTQKNTELTRCFVLDVDIRPDEEDHYHTFDEAYEGVEQVRTAFNLPQPIIVNSGFGLHVYWPMADGIESKTWVKFGRSSSGLSSLWHRKWLPMVPASRTVQAYFASHYRLISSRNHPQPLKLFSGTTTS